MMNYLCGDGYDSMDMLTPIVRNQDQEQFSSYSIVYMHEAWAASILNSSYSLHCFYKSYSVLTNDEVLANNSSRE